MGNTNNMITSEELDTLSKQTGLQGEELRKQFSNFKKLDLQQKGNQRALQYQYFANLKARFLQIKNRFSQNLFLELCTNKHFRFDIFTLFQRILPSCFKPERLGSNSKDMFPKKTWWPVSTSRETTMNLLSNCFSNSLTPYKRKRLAFIPTII